MSLDAFKESLVEELGNKVAFTVPVLGGVPVAESVVVTGIVMAALIALALALTLSMGSFAAMAAGIVVLLLERKQSASWRETVRFICPVLARAVLGVGTGLLTYLAAARTGVPWLCLLKRPRNSGSHQE